jgi:hypothetical protein
MMSTEYSYDDGCLAILLSVSDSRFLVHGDEKEDTAASRRDRE